MNIGAFNTIYIAKPGYEDELSDELGTVSGVIGNLVFSSRQKKDICFAQDVWLDTIIVEFDSISAAVKLLRQAGKFWFLNPIENIRRSRLIEAELRKLPALLQEFPIQEQLPPIGCFSLLNKNTLVYSAKRWKNPPLGDFQFIEDKLNPPNRAYLKLWEAISLLKNNPQPHELALDLGASPGGWTYVMQSLGVNVIAVDKAPLESRIANLANITFLQQSAFALDPNAQPFQLDWLLCDVACYPERLYELATKWITANKANQLIMTVKLQGKTNLSVIEQFQALPGARVIQLFQNKHEATFFYPAPDSLFVPF